MNEKQKLLNPSENISQVYPIYFFIFIIILNFEIRRGRKVHVLAKLYQPMRLRFAIKLKKNFAVLSSLNLCNHQYQLDVLRVPYIQIFTEIRFI